jgi:hypothetical protein
VISAILSATVAGCSQKVTLTSHQQTLAAKETDSTSFRVLSQDSISALMSDSRFYKVQAESFDLDGFNVISNYWSSEGKYIEATSSDALASFNFNLASGMYTIYLIPTMLEAQPSMLAPVLTKQSEDEEEIKALGPPTKVTKDESNLDPTNSIRLASFVVKLEQGEDLYLDSFETGQKLDFIIIVPHENGSEPEPNPNPVPRPSSSTSPKPSPSPSPSPVPAGPTFTQVNNQILQPKCATSGCHDVASKKGGFSYANYTDTMKSVVKGNATSSQLYDSVSKNRMPFNPKLTATEIKLIGDWINAGAANN